METKVPDSVGDPRARELYVDVNEARRAIKAVADTVGDLRERCSQAIRTAGISNEVPANVAIAFRHLEDASMRLGKGLQALDGGVSVYDRSTTVGA